jgi:hypothetical protein
MSDQSYRNIYQSVKVLVDSNFRNNPLDATNDFKYDLDKSIDRVKNVYVNSVQIPFTYYTTTAINNVFSTSLGNTVIPPGNYNSGTIVTTLKNGLNNDAAPAIWDVVFSPTTLKLTVSADTPFEIIATVANSIAPNLGFNVDTVGPNTSFIGDGTIDLSGPRYLVIKSSLIGENRSLTTTVAPAVTSQDIIHTIPVNTNPGGVVLDVAPQPRYNILGFKTSFFKNIDFRLEDDRGNPLDLNGNDWSVQYVFELR